MRLDPRQAADYLKRSEKTLANWRSQGNGPPFIKCGSRILYDQDVLDQWLAGRSYTSTADYQARRITG